MDGLRTALPAGAAEGEHGGPSNHFDREVTGSGDESTSQIFEFFGVGVALSPFTSLFAVQFIN